MLRHRLICSVLILSVLCLSFWWESFLPANGWPAGSVLLIVLGLVAVAAAVELAGLLRACGLACHTWLLVLGAWVGISQSWLANLFVSPEMHMPMALGLLAGLFLLVLGWHIRQAKVAGAMSAASSTLLAYVYLGVLPGFFLLIRLDHTAPVVLAVIFLTKCGDIGAYFTGRSLGKHKLIAWLSPGKTWEGLAGAVCLSGTAAWGLASWCNETQYAWHILATGESVHVPIDLVHAVGVGIILALVGHGGDLIASLFKRDANCKDTGQTIPGFGGIIDVIDSPLLTAPVAYGLLHWLI